MKTTRILSVGSLFALTVTSAALYSLAHGTTLGTGVEIAAKKPLPIKISIARQSSDGSYVRPNLTIKSTEITVTLDQHGLFAEVKGARIQGKNGDYTFTKSGTYPVKSGKYTHYVFGTPGSGSSLQAALITSTISYR